MSVHTRQYMGSIPRFRLGLAGVIVGVTTSAFAQTTVEVPGSQPDVLWSSLPAGRVNAKQVMHLAISLEPADKQGLIDMADRVSNPKSPDYRKWLTPAQIGAKFGVSQTKVNEVVSFLKSKGLKVTLVAKNRFSILADGTASAVEKAFDTKINHYQAIRAVDGRPEYYAPAGPLKMPAKIAAYVTDVSGVENYYRPVPQVALTPSQTRTLYNIAPIFDSLYQGAGRTIGISNWDAYDTNNIKLFYNQFNLPIPSGGLLSNVRIVTIDGGATGAAQGEADLDCQMPLISAPLANLVVYDSGGGLLPVLTREADENACDIISESWGWRGTDSTLESAHTIHAAMSVQGITYMAASGDYGTGPYIVGNSPFLPYPGSDPEVLMVGGTIATVQPSGARVSEVAWSLSSNGLGAGGGYVNYPYSFNKLPSWQTGNGVPTTYNYRLIPDVAMQASDNTDSSSYQFFFEGNLITAIGTSFTSPMTAGAFATLEEKLIATGQLTAVNGKYRLGRVQDFLYALNGRSDVFYDITSGDIGAMADGNRAAATTGWDFASGWGAIDFDALSGVFGASLDTATDSAVSASIWNAVGDSTTGSYSDLADADSNDFTVRSVTQRGVGNVAAAEVDFVTTEVPQNIVRLVANFTLTNQPRGTTNYIYAYNVLKSKWDLISTKAYKAEDIAMDLQLSASKYVSDSKQVRVIIRTVVPTRLINGQYSLGIDQAKLTESYLATSG